MKNEVLLLMIRNENKPCPDYTRQQQQNLYL